MCERVKVTRLIAFLNLEDGVEKVGGALRTVQRDDLINIGLGSCVTCMISE